MGSPARSVSVMTDKLLENRAAVESLAANPEETVKKAADFATKVTKFQDDVFIYRMVVAFLGLTTLIVVVGCMVFAFMKTSELPSALVAIGSAAIGALAGLLAPTPAR